jgi:arylsulfatase
MPDLADRAIKWVRQEKALTPDRPFFAYFAPGATHAPHHVPREWAEKYQGRFDDGWDALRERTFARQQELGVIPQDAELTRRHDEIPAWDDMDPQLKPVLARQMEVYAGFLEHADHHIGRLIDALAALQVLDDTLIYLIIGDNGASAEGSLQGTLNEVAIAEAPDLETPEFLAANIDKLGTPRPTTTTRSAGRMPCAPPTSGPSRSPPTGAAPATPPSSTGRMASRPRRSCAPSSAT